MSSEKTLFNVSRVVEEAGIRANLPDGPVQAIEADAWRWTWGELVEQDRLAEIHVLVQEDRQSNRLHTEIQSLAWSLNDRKLAHAPRPHRSEELTESMSRLIDGEDAFNDATKELESRLGKVWDETLTCAHQLYDFQKEREERQQQLEERLKQQKKKRAFADNHV